MKECIIRWLPWKWCLSVVTAFLAKNKPGLRYPKLCLNQDIFTGLKGQEHQEKYISLLSKIEATLNNCKTLSKRANENVKFTCYGNKSYLNNIAHLAFLCTFFTLIYSFKICRNVTPFLLE